MITIYLVLRSLILTFVAIGLIYSQKKDNKIQENDVELKTSIEREIDQTAEKIAEHMIYIIITILIIVIIEPFCLIYLNK